MMEVQQGLYELLFRVFADSFNVRLEIVVSLYVGSGPVLQSLRASSSFAVSFERFNRLLRVCYLFLRAEGFTVVAFSVETLWLLPYSAVLAGFSHFWSSLTALKKVSKRRRNRSDLSTTLEMIHSWKFYKNVEFMLLCGNSSTALYRRIRSGIVSPCKQQIWCR